MEPALANKRIVIIEDEESLLSILAQKFTDSGAIVQTAGDGEAGLAAIESFHPDLVLLDMMLPKVSGFQILEKLTEQHHLPMLPVLIISNSGQPVEIERAMSMGVRGYIVKVNFDPQEVIKKVAEILVASPAESAPVPISAAPAEAVPGATRILLVEDDLFILQLLNDKLRRSNCTTFVASDAETALGILRKNPVDLILLDIILPGMDGFTFLQQLKNDEQFKNIPVIFLSNLGQREEIDRGMKMGAVDYIIKANNSPAEIIDRVQQVLEKTR